MQVKDNEIQDAERILLSKGEKFDKERKSFIKNFATIDLQAVPGSGKTTALLAKLLILEKYLPFDDGSAVLVISHTNTAVDEIRERIGKHCPRLFSYPNHVGTIQSFVDQYLAIPYYVNKYKKKPYRIDNEIYEENARKYSSIFLTGFNRQEQNNAKSYLRVNELYKSLGIAFREEQEVLINNDTGKEIDIRKPRGRTSQANYSDWSINEKNQVKEWLRGFKNKLFESGIISFDDAYYLAQKAIRTYPLLKQLLRRRFRYVFVDEMQDMDKQQYDLLEYIFFDNGNANVTYQRIGDRNQAIYGRVKSEEFWQNEGRTTLAINGSCRFSQEIANVIQCFSLHGDRTTSMSTHKSNKPFLLIYDDNSISSVLPKFVELIQGKQKTNEFPKSPRYAVKAIGWRKKMAGQGKVRIKDYFPEFTDTSPRVKIDYPTLWSYLSSVRKPVQNKYELAEGRKNILNALLRILRYENILIDNRGVHHTKRSLMNFLKEKHSEHYEDLKLNLYKWSKGIYVGCIASIHQGAKEYFEGLLKKVFGKNSISQEVNQFLNNKDGVEVTVMNDAVRENTNNNIYKYRNLNVEVGTIHSAKGETHSATLYLETYYFNDGGNSYESQRLKEFFKGNSVSGGLSKHVVESIKMAYVGMSRPKYLLCVAVHKKRIEEYQKDIPDNLWEKIEI